MYKIAICDDDKNYREKIEKVIETEGILPKSEIKCTPCQGQIKKKGFLFSGQ